MSTKSTIKHGEMPDGQVFHLHEDVLFEDGYVGLDLTNVEFSVKSWEGPKGLQTRIELQIPREIAIKLGLLPA